MGRKINHAKLNRDRRAASNSEPAFQPGDEIEAVEVFAPPEPEKVPFYSYYQGTDRNPERKEAAIAAAKKRERLFKIEDAVKRMNAKKALDE